MTASIELAVLLVVVGPFVVVLCLLNRRDRREAALWTAMGPWLTGIDPELPARSPSGSASRSGGTAPS
jgi:hypothetical protein